MKTFAELKRDLQVGRKLKMTFHHFGEGRFKLIGIEREILKAQSNGIYLKTEGTKNGSFLDLPCASLTEYDGKTIKIYGIGKRNLTAQEKSILDNEPSMKKENKQLVENDIMSDGSTTYYMDKRYYNENNANWRYDWQKGCKLDINDMKMFDKSIKGNLEIEYQLI
jgi:hypothetical protein